MNALTCLPLVLVPLASPLPGPLPAQDAPEAVEIGTTKNVHRLGKLWFAGQFPAEDVVTIGALGVRRVITLRQDGEVDWDEERTVEAAGMEFVSLGFREPETLTDELIDRLRELLADEDTPTFLHCGSANRVGGAWIPFRVLDQGVPLEQAVAEARVIGLRTDGYRERALAYIEAHAPDPAQDKVTLPEGLNDKFKSPDLDVSEFMGRFEVESREVYASRHAVVQALGLVPGMRVADIGAGTGLYTFLISEAVGADGWVFAVDIAPRFIQSILKLASERRVTNVTGVLCPENSTGLPPSSVDLAYICDTYHHLEFPAQTLRSVYRALIPGGRLVVIDFDRIPGVSREWILEHIRGNKQVFRGEIEALGFRFVREIEVEGLEDNYVLEFQKPAE